MTLQLPAKRSGHFNKGIMTYNCIFNHSPSTGYIQSAVAYSVETIYSRAISRLCFFQGFCWQNDSHTIKYFSLYLYKKHQIDQGSTRNEIRIRKMKLGYAVRQVSYFQNGLYMKLKFYLSFNFEINTDYIFHSGTIPACQMCATIRSTVEFQIEFCIHLYSIAGIQTDVKLHLHSKYEVRVGSELYMGFLCRVQVDAGVIIYSIYGVQRYAGICATSVFT